MPLPIMRFELDPTGTNPDNLIVNEPHSLVNRPIRAIAPTYGPFFTDSLKVYDGGSQQLLVRGTHYQTAELLQDATVQYGKEICSVILIIDANVATVVNIDYQVLGGYFTNDSTAIANLYSTIINDNRPVAWEALLNKPLEYSPSLHRHLVEDIYGFEPIVASIERLRNAIILTDVPAFEAVLDGVRKLVSEVDCRLALTNTPAPGMMSHWAFLASMTHRYLIDGYRFGYIPVEIYKGSSVDIQVIAKDPIANGPKYWYIIHDGTTDSDFINVTGTVGITDGLGQFAIQLNNDSVYKPVVKFAIGLKHTTADVDYMAISCRIRISNRIGFEGSISIRDVSIHPDLASYWGEDITPVTLFLSRSVIDAPIDIRDRTDYIGFDGTISIRDITIYPNLMSYWGEDITPVTLFLNKTVIA